MLKAIFGSRLLLVITLLTAALVTAVCTRPADSSAPGAVSADSTRSASEASADTVHG
jgi:hypothetical protein